MNNNKLLSKLPGKNLAGILAFIVLTFGLSLIFYKLLSEQRAQIIVHADYAKLTDFVYYLENVKEFWFGTETRLYDPETTQAIFTRLFGGDYPPAMLLHIIPPALLIWFPLAVIGLSSTAWAYAIWLGVSYAALGLALLNLYAFVNQRVKTASYILVIVFLSSFFSSVTVDNIGAGQTSVFMSAILILLLRRLQSLPSSQPSIDGWLILYGVLLGIKPQFLLFGVLILLLFSRQKETLWVIALTGCICLILTPRLGWLWPLEYLRTIDKHSTTQLPGFFSDTIILDIMSNFRGTFYRYIGANAATAISTFVFIGSIVTVFAIGVYHTIRFPVKTSPGWADHTKWVWCIVMLESYLLFSPHLYTYEDLLAMPLIAIVFLNAPTKLRGTFWTLLVCVLFFVHLQSKLFVVNQLHLLYWLLKLSFGICTVISIWPRSAKSLQHITNHNP